MKSAHFSKILFFTFFLLTASNLYPCTTAIILGKYTVNGKPLLYKHRDSEHEQNKLMYFSDGKYDYVGLVNSADVEGKEVWAGTNSAGFSIMNSASYNLKPESDTTSSMDKEGVVMKLALQRCATIEDFEKMLKELPKPLGVEANFGVIDAFGGAAYYETDNYNFTKFDVNDLSVAPNGYLIRTNYSNTGCDAEGYGYIRFAQAKELFGEIDKFSVEFLSENVSRCLKHGLTGQDLTKMERVASGKTKFANMDDYIPRNSSVSTVIIEGVAAGEDVSKTTMWTTLGFQLTSVTVPVWVYGGASLPDIMIADETGNAPLCVKSLKLKEKCFPVKQGSGSRYMNVAALINKDKNGILQLLKPVEQKVFEQTELIKNKFGSSNFSKEEIQKYYKWLNEFITKEYLLKFDI